MMKNDNYSQSATDGCLSMHVVRLILTPQSSGISPALMFNVKSSLTIFAPGLLRGERTQQELSPFGVGWFCWKSRWPLRFGDRWAQYFIFRVYRHPNSAGAIDACLVWLWANDRLVNCAVWTNSFFFVWSAHRRASGSCWSHKPQRFFRSVPHKDLAGDFFIIEVKHRLDHFGIHIPRIDGH